MSPTEEEPKTQPQTGKKSWGAIGGGKKSDSKKTPPAAAKSPLSLPGSKKRGGIFQSRMTKLSTTGTFQVVSKHLLSILELSKAI